MTSCMLGLIYLKYLFTLLVHNINKLDKCVAIAIVTLLLVSIHYTVFVLHT